MDVLMAVSERASSPCRRAGLQHPRGLPRWDDYVSEGVAKRRTAFEL
jgi:hypothetical protein